MERVKLDRTVLSLCGALGRRSVVRVEGRSMWPTFAPGARLRVGHAGPLPSFGAVVVLAGAERMTAHRVVARRWTAGRLWLRTKGDACCFADPGWVDAEHVLGVVEGILTRRGVRRVGVRGLLACIVAAVSRTIGAAAWAARAGAERAGLARFPGAVPRPTREGARR